MLGSCKRFDRTEVTKSSVYPKTCHTQAISRISRDVTANEDTIYLSLSLLDIICPRRWIRDREATDDMPRCIHELTGAGQWDFPNLMEFVVTTMQGQPQQNGRLEQHGKNLGTH